ncbi:hypothetical protein C8J55DRAFT_566136 [Lentinula edodes]|uniref:Uncharacterized protein n=1 Tax=Lentinula lateritia TaxID=40482 RepID=A0A9W8ZSY9_9AGAR|nr:hypothetical protein C8J55DRAFT_566136 [Lentinula edodes]
MFKLPTSIYFSLFIFGSFYLVSFISPACAAPLPGSATPDIYNITSLSNSVDSSNEYGLTSVTQVIDRRSKGNLNPVERMWGQGDYNLYRNWMTSFFPEGLTRKNIAKYFAGGDFTEYLGVNLATGKSGKRGNYNAGVYLYTGPRYRGNHPDDLVVKVISRAGGDGGPDFHAYGEAMALDLVGQYVDSGKVPWTTTTKETNRRTGTVRIVSKDIDLYAIIMKRVEGAPIEETPEWKRASSKTRNGMMADMKILIEAQVMDLWSNHRLIDAYGSFLGARKDLISPSIRSDINRNNIHVVFDRRGLITSARLFDFGYPGIISVRPETRRQDIEVWFDQCWKFFWA